MEEETAFMTFKDSVPVETVQEDNAIETQEDSLPQFRTSENEQKPGTDEDSEGSDDDSSLPELMPKTAMDDEEEDSESSDDDSSMPGLRPRTQAENGEESSNDSDSEGEKSIGIQMVRIKFQNSEGLTQMNPANKSN